MYSKFKKMTSPKKRLEGLVASVRSWSASELSDFSVFLENDKTDLHQILFQGLGENTNFLISTCIENTAPGL